MTKKIPFDAMFTGVIVSSFSVFFGTLKFSKKLRTGNSCFTAQNDRSTTNTKTVCRIALKT